MADWYAARPPRGSAIAALAAAARPAPRRCSAIRYSGISGSSKSSSSLSGARVRDAGGDVGVPSWESQTDPNGVARGALGADASGIELLFFASMSSSIDRSPRLAAPSAAAGDASGRLALAAATASAAASATASATAPGGVIALGAAGSRRAVRTVAERTVHADVVEGEDLGRGQVRLGQRAGRLGEPLAGERDDRTRARGDGGAGSRGCGDRTTATTTAGRRRRDRLGLTGSSAATAATAAATAAGALGLLVGNLGHRQVRIVVGDAASRARALLDPGQLDDVGELVGDLDEVGARVATEADDLDADALLLDRPDRRGEVAVTGHHDGDVEVPGRLHHVDDELDVEVRLDLAVAVLADVLAHDLVVAPAQEVVEVALVLVVRVEARVGIRPHEIAAGRGRLEQRDVVDVHAGRLGRIEDVRHVHEDGDVLAHSDSLVLSIRPAGAITLHGGAVIRRGARRIPPRPRCRWRRGPASPKPIASRRARAA